MSRENGDEVGETAGVRCWKDPEATVITLLFTLIKMETTEGFYAKE